MNVFIHTNTAPVWSHEFVERCTLRVWNSSAIFLLLSYITSKIPGVYFLVSKVLPGTYMFSTALT